MQQRAWGATARSRELGITEMAETAGSAFESGGRGRAGPHSPPVRRARFDGRITAGVTAVATVVALLCGGAAGATTVHVQTHHKTSGTVTSVNGSSAPGSCGTSGMPGDFTVSSNSTTFTIDVGASSTSFSEKGVTSPSFAIVCAADQVRTTGTLSANDIVTATSVVVIPPPTAHVTGTVLSVNGASGSGSCGTSGMAGNFTVSANNITVTIDVGASSTSFSEKGVSSPSFAIVCAGDKARAVGPFSTADVMAAKSVTVIPPPPARVSGTVTSVNGSSASGTCGTSGTAGDFVAASKNATSTVEVGATSTTFKKNGVSTPTFAALCVGDKVRAVGTTPVTGVLSATAVTIIAPRPHRVSGPVTSVNGTATPGTCGAAGVPGDFTVASHHAPATVQVSSPTTFKEKGVSAPTFAAVCVGDKVRAIGILSATGPLAASRVTVVPPPPKRVAGTVLAVNGMDTCGTAGAAGSFTLSSGSTGYTVNVEPTGTVFAEHGVSAPSFALVCAGDKVKTVDSVAPSGTLTANDVVILPHS